MKPTATQHLAPPPIQKKQSDKQLKQLIESYYTQVGTVMLPVIEASMVLSDVKIKEGTQADKCSEKKRAQEYGKLILLSTGIVLLCTMLGVLAKPAVLLFGLFWGVIFTRHQAKLDHQLTQTLLYWLILALLTALQNILHLALFFMPFYHSLKLFLLVSLLYPDINLKVRIYKEYFQPRLAHLAQVVAEDK